MHDQGDYVEDSEIYEDDHGNGHRHHQQDHHDHRNHQQQQQHSGYDEQYDQYNQQDHRDHRDHREQPDDGYGYDDEPEGYGQGAKEYYQYHGTSNGSRHHRQDDMW